MQKLGQRLVGTALGESAVRVREILALWSTVYSDPEKGGMACQDACTRRLLPGLAVPERGFIDVGAHIGSVLAHVRRAHPGMPILAIEADPEKAAQLARRFPDIRVESCAAGEQDGTVTFTIDTKRPGFSSLDSQNIPEAQASRLSVRLRRLDDVVPASFDAGLMKIDVEGAELGVLRGSTQLIARCRPTILFESGPNGGQSLGYTAEALYDWFRDVEYLVFVPDRVAHDGPSLSRDGFLDSHAYPFRTLNYFAVPAEGRQAIRDRARAALGITPTS